MDAGAGVLRGAVYFRSEAPPPPLPALPRDASRASTRALGAKPGWTAPGHAEPTLDEETRRRVQLEGAVVNLRRLVVNLPPVDARESPATSPSNGGERDASPRPVTARRRERALRLRLRPQLDVEVLTRHHAVLNELGQLQVVATREFALRELSAGREAPMGTELPAHLRLLLLRPARAFQERPMMPCASKRFQLDNADHRHGYEEPLRDRDKDWREELWTDLAPTLFQDTPREAAEAGPSSGELRDARPPRKVFLDGVLMNRLLITRQGLRLGGCPAVVSVLGMGIAGRVFMSSHRAPRHLRIEAYCPARARTASLRVDLSDLERLLADEAHLLQPGHKQALCDRLLDRLELDEAAFALRLRPRADPSHRAALWSRRRRLRAEALARVTLLATDAAAPADASRRRRAALPARARRPWLRVQGREVSRVLLLAGLRLVVSVRTLPRRAATLEVTAYDQETSARMELLVSAKELGAAVGDRRDPSLWDAARRRGNCERLLPLLSVQTTASEEGAEEMALVLNGRAGLPVADVRGLRRHGRGAAADRRAGPQLRRQPSASEPALAALAGLTSAASTRQLRLSSLFGRRSSTVLLRATSRRDMAAARAGPAAEGGPYGGTEAASGEPASGEDPGGAARGSGALLGRALARVSGQPCVASVFGAAGARWVRWDLYFPGGCTARSEWLAAEELDALMKGRAADWALAELLRRPRTDRGDMVRMAARGLFARTPDGGVRVLRELYRHGHKLRSLAQCGRAQFAYCVLALELLPGGRGLRASAWERGACKSCALELPAAEAAAVLEGCAAATALEREVQLGALAATFAVSAAAEGGLELVQLDDHVQ